MTHAQYAYAGGFEDVDAFRVGRFWENNYVTDGARGQSRTHNGCAGGGGVNVFGCSAISRILFRPIVHTHKPS